MFDAGTDIMSVKLTMKRMQGYAAPKKAAKLNMALISRLKLLGKAAKDKACHISVKLTQQGLCAVNLRQYVCYHVLYRKICRRKPSPCYIVFILV